MNSTQPALSRQRPLTEWRCYYANHERELRPDCEGVAAVAYGPIVLCAACDLRRSAVGKGTLPRPVPGGALNHLADAAHSSAEADRLLSGAAHAARRAGASWAQIGDAVGLSRQGAQQRWARGEK